MRFLMVTIAALMVGFAANAQEARQITVVGEGRMEAVPDMAVISLGVTTEAKTAAGAMRDNAGQVAVIIEALGAAGIEARDMQTSQLNLHPRMDHSRAGNGQPPVVVGFVASNMLTVRMRDLTTMGAPLDTVLGAGANQFHGLSFTLSDPEPARDAARQDAIADARRKAELYAEAAGVALGQVVTISEHGQGRPQPMMMEAASMARGGDVPIVPGEVTAEAAVTVVYELIDLE